MFVRYGITSPALLLLSVAAVAAAIYMQLDTFARQEGIAPFILTLLAGYTLAKQKRSPGEQAGRADWLVQGLLLVPILFIWQVSGFELELDQLSFLVLLVVFTLLFSTQLRGAAVLKALAMLTVMFVLVPALDALETVLSYPMRRLSAMLVYTGLSGFDSGLVLNGTELSFTSMRINVTEACDGLNLMQNLLWIIWLNGMLLGRGWFHQLLCFLLKTPLVLVVNTIRIFVLTALVWMEGPEILAGSLHIYTGWLAVAVAAMLYLYLDKRMAGDDERVLETPKQPQTA